VWSKISSFSWTYSREGCGNFRCGTPQLKCPQHFFSSRCLRASSEAGGESFLNLDTQGIVGACVKWIPRLDNCGPS
jgi:hypothetical protein